MVDAYLVEFEKGEFQLKLPDVIIKELKWKLGDELLVEYAEVDMHMGLIISNTRLAKRNNDSKKHDI